VFESIKILFMVDLQDNNAPCPKLIHSLTRSDQRI